MPLFSVWLWWCVFKLYFHPNIFPQKLQNRNVFWQASLVLCVRHQGNTQKETVADVLTPVAHKVFVHFQRFSTFITWKISTKCALCKNVLYWIRHACLTGGKDLQTVEETRTNATDVTMPLLKQAFWGHILKCTVEKVKHMQSMWLYLLWSGLFESTYYNPHWRKLKQMHPM